MFELHKTLAHGCFVMGEFTLSRVLLSRDTSYRGRIKTTELDYAALNFDAKYSIIPCKLRFLVRFCLV
jgi:hypothetical protein